MRAEGLLWTKAEETFREWWESTGQHQYPGMPMPHAQDLFTLGWRAAMGEYFRQQKDQPGEFI